MAHALDFSKGFAAFTRRQNTRPAWHGLGGETPEDAPLEVWARNGGLDFRIIKVPALYKAPMKLQQVPNRCVLMRSDTEEALAVVSDRYNVVQPMEVLDFFRNLIDGFGFRMETCGVLKGGQRVWALANTGMELAIRGIDGVKGYLLLVTSCDTQLATTAMFTSVRVVCNNTLELATGVNDGKRITVPHSRVFKADEVQSQLGIIETQWGAFHDQLTVLADRKVSDDEVRQWLIEVLGDPELPLQDQPNTKAMRKVYQLFNGQAVGSELVTARHTAWGLVNAVTEYVDYHARAHSDATRLNSAWLGGGAKLKQRAFHTALELAA